MTEVQTDAAPEALIADFLRWLEPEPKAYEAVMEAWRTSCPRLTVFEDAIERGLVRRGHLSAGAASVEITAEGRGWLMRRQGR